MIFPVVLSVTTMLSSAPLPPSVALDALTSIPYPVAPLGVRAASIPTYVFFIVVPPAVLPIKIRVVAFPYT